MFSVNELYEEVCTHDVPEQERKFAWNWFTEIDERKVSEIDHLNWYLDNQNISANVKERLCNKVRERSEQEAMKNAFLTDIVGSPNEYVARIGEFTNKIRNDYLKRAIMYLVLGFFTIMFFALLKISVKYSYEQGDTFAHLDLISFFGCLVFAMAIAFLIIGIRELCHSDPRNCKKLAKDKVRAIIGEKAMESSLVLTKEESEICRLNIIINNYKFIKPSEQTAPE